jgi:hypothetical protein
MRRLEVAGKTEWISAVEREAEREIALLAECRQIPGCEALVSLLEKIIPATAASFDAHNGSLDPYVSALAAEDAARAELVRAQAAKSRGANTRAAVLKLRDDVDAADGFLLAARAAVPVARALARPIVMHDWSGIQNPEPIRTMISAWARASSSRVFKGHTPDFSDEIRERWLALPDEAVTLWLAYYVEKEIARSNLIWGDPVYTVEQLKRYKHSGDAPSDEAEMRENADQYRAQRRARKAAVIAKARATIEEARRTINSEGTV